MIRNDLLADLETSIVVLETTKGYTEFDIIDCMAHIIQNRSNVKQKDLFGNNKKRKPKEINIPDKAIELSELFAKLFSLNRKPTKPINIAVGARLLVKLCELAGSWEQVEWAIRYSQDAENIKDKFMPVIWSMDSLLEKYPQLIAHLARKQNTEKNEAFNKNSQGYKKPVRTVVYWDQNAFKYISYPESHNKCPFEPNCDIDTFQAMTKEARRKYFNVRTKEEMEIEDAKVKATIKKLKEELR